MKHTALSLLLLASISILSCGRPAYKLAVGTFGDNIHEVSFDGRSFVPLATLPMKDPSYLAIGEDGELLCPSHLGKGAYFCAFRNGKQICRTDSLGLGPAHIWHVAGTPLNVVSEYRGGSISVVRCEGSDCRRVQFLRYEGKGADPKRQKSTHVHQAKEIPAAICTAAGIHGRWILAADLGLDRIHVLELTPDEDAPLQDRPELEIPCGPASGPRHMEFNPATGTLYALTELSNELIAWKISANSEGWPLFSEIQRFTVPGAGFQGGGDIHLSPDGRTIYTSHRCGNDGIARFALSADGSFRFLDYVNTAEHPRNFCITADGKWLLAACKNDRCIEVFKRSPRSGRLRKTGVRMDFATDEPVCLLLIP